MISISKFNKLH